VKKNILFILLIVTAVSTVYSQDFGFGFGFDEEEETASSPQVSVKAGGELLLEIMPYFNDLGESVNILDISNHNFKFNFSLTSAYVDIITSLSINAASVSELWTVDPELKELNYTPRIIDEFFLRLYMGPVNIEAGFRKLTWGRADSGGPLDVTNPIDYSDLRNISDLKARKIARPMLHLTWNLSNFSKLEGVFIPNFYADRFASGGRWAPSQYAGMTEAAASFGIIVEFPDTTSIKYFQGGLRYTNTIGQADIGVQYYYGNLFRPSFSINGVDAFILDLFTGQYFNSSYTGNPSLLSPQIKYTRYHQLGIDYAQVLFGFNVRAEAAFFLTEDFYGDNGSHRNPFIGWSLGFDRTLFWGININFQCNETIRLFDGKVGDIPYVDTEAGTDMTSTRITVQLSKKFLRDNLETRVSVLWGIEDSDCYIIPAILWTYGNLIFELSAGIFAGDRSGELGQYRDNSFLKLGVKYTF
jgi:hypothetical protein